MPSSDIFAFSSPRRRSAVARSSSGPTRTRQSCPASELTRSANAVKPAPRKRPTSVVALDATAQRAEPVRPALTRGFAVQVGAFRAESDANTLVGRLRGAGFTAFAERINSDAGQLWRVRVGPELDRATADRRRGELKAKMALDGMIVSHP